MQLQNFAKENGFNVSSRYAVINTANIVSQFEAAGFQHVRSSIAKVRSQERQGYQKHLLVFRHPDMNLRGVNDSVPEIILKNSYDGTTSFELLLGVYRLVCANGLVAGTTYSSVRVKHVGQNALTKAVEGAFEVSRQVETAASNIERMSSIQLSQSEANEFARQAWTLVAPETAVNYSLESLLRARRGPDTGMDLWTVFNRVQENLIRGGVQYKTVNQAGVVRNATRRQVKSIDANLYINRGLWTIAETFAK